MLKDLGEGNLVLHFINKVTHSEGDSGSQYVSAATISANPTANTDSVSGLPAFHYQVDIMSLAFMS
jgi:hypothetical protein